MEEILYKRINSQKMSMNMHKKPYNNFKKLNYQFLNKNKKNK